MGPKPKGKGKDKYIFQINSHSNHKILKSEDVLPFIVLINIIDDSGP